MPGVDAASRSEPAPPTAHRIGHGLAVGVLAALVAGVVTGVPARALMRVVATAAGHHGQFSVVASVGIVAVFVLAALPGAVLAATTSHRRRWILLAVGAVALCIPATGVAADELGSTAEWSAGRFVTVAAVSLAVYLCIAALPMVAILVVRRFTPPARRGSAGG